MAMLSNSLELSIYAKDSVTVRFPTLNFLCPQSVLSLLEARKVVLEIGSRFQIRIYIYMSALLGITVALMTYLFGMGSGLISQDLMETNFFIPIVVHTAFLGVSCLAMLLPLSFINK